MSVPVGIRTHSEAHFQAEVLKLAALLGWRIYHTYRSDRSPSGFPDLVLVRKGRLVFAELKRESGRTTPAQDAWLADLEAVAGPPEVFLWKPSMLAEIAEVLGS